VGEDVDSAAGKAIVKGRPRSAQRRGPQAANAAEEAATDAPRPAPPDGGYPVDDADRHLINYHRQFVAGSDKDVYYRTTRAIVVAARRWRKLANERVKAVGQTMARWETLFLVGFSGEELTQSELARLISVEGPTMVRMLDVLAREELIERRQSDSDRRVTVNRITPRGTQVIGDIMEITNSLRAELLQDIDPAQLSITIDVLERILRRLDEMR